MLLNELVDDLLLFLNINKQSFQEKNIVGVKI